MEELKPAPTDHVIKKAYNDAFYKSRLEDKLQELETSHVFIVGVMTSYCVRATAEAALNRDLEVAVVDRCTADETDNLHEIGLTLMRALGAEIVPKDEVVYHRLKGARSLARPIME